MSIDIPFEDICKNKKPKYEVNDMVFVTNRNGELQKAIIKSVHPIGFVYELDREIKVGKSWYVGSDGYQDDTWAITLAPENMLYDVGDKIELTAEMVQQFFKNETNT